MADYTICQDDGEAGGAWDIFQRVLVSHEELAELRDMMEQGVTVAFCMRAGGWPRPGGGEILGTCYCQPSAQGALRGLFEQLLTDTIGYYPDFLIILNRDWWEDSDPDKREVLIVHEALHAGWAKDQFGTPKVNRQTGIPVPSIRPHDVEEFTAVVARYGAWKGDLAEFLAAANGSDTRGQ